MNLDELYRLVNTGSRTDLIAFINASDLSPLLKPIISMQINIQSDESIGKFRTVAREALDVYKAGGNKALIEFAAARGLPAPFITVLTNKLSG